jgi:endonuclease/exonuclease/phosphatase family metal-dependent hydrolase
MTEHHDEELTSLKITMRWARRISFSVLSLVAFGAFLVLLVALGLYQFGYRPLDTDSEDVRLAHWGGAEKSRPDRPELRIFSLNLNFAAGSNHLDLESGESRPLDRDAVTDRLNRLAALVLSLDVDVLMLQEVDFNSKYAGNFDQAEYLARRLRYGYLAKVYSWKHPYAPFPDPFHSKMLGPMESGMAVIARVPLLKSSRFSLPGAVFGNWWQTTFGPTYCLHMVEISLRDQELRLFQTHLTNGSILDRERQGREVAQLVGRETLGKSLLVGTLGAPPPDIRVAGPTVKRDNTVPLVRHRMNFRVPVDDFDLLDDPSNATFTDDKGSSVLDYVMPEKGLRVSKLEVIATPEDVTPHRGILIELTL